MIRGKKDFCGMLLAGILSLLLLLLFERDSAMEEIAAPISAEGSDCPIAVRREDELFEMDLEQYLVGVVLAEMPADFLPEAMKAQAIAARTYAMKSKLTGGKHHDGSVCTNHACCQAYVPEYVYLQSTGRPEDLIYVRKAVSETKGQVLCYQGNLIEATYFSCSGGSTESSEDVWGSAFPYLVAKPSPGEEGAFCYETVQVFSADELEQMLHVSLPSDPVEWFSDWEYTKGGGVAAVRIGNRRFSGLRLRELLGLHSTLFTIEAGEDCVELNTYGYGHRVGLSQYGAQAMAENGKTCREILEYYYDGTRIESYQDLETAIEMF